MDRESSRHVVALVLAFPQGVQSAWHQQNTGKMHDFGLRTLITAPVGIPISGPNRPETLENTAKKRFDLLIPERLDPFQAALKRGFQTRNGEMDLAGLLGELADD